MTLLDTLIAFSLRNAPPAEVPDARASVAVWCGGPCDAAAVDELKGALSQDYAQSRRLPRRQATEAVFTFQVLPAMVYGLYTPEQVDALSAGLSDAEEALLQEDGEVVVIGTARPAATSVDGLRTLNAAVHYFATAQSGVLEDLDTRELYGLETWASFRIDTLGTPIWIWEQFTLDWTEERVVTRGLRRLGLHELVIDGVPVEWQADLASVVVLFAQHTYEGWQPARTFSVAVDAIENPDVRTWLQQWQWYPDDPGVTLAGTGRAELSVRNHAPQKGDPDGPLLELGVKGRWGDPKAWASILDQLWGYGVTEKQGDPLPDPERATPQPPSGWGGYQE